VGPRQGAAMMGNVRFAGLFSWSTNYCARGWNAAKLSAALTVEACGYQHHPEWLYRDLVGFRHLNTADRLRACRRWLRVAGQRPMDHRRRNTCGKCHRTWIGGDWCPCGQGTAWVVEWVHERSWCLGCGSSGDAHLVQGPCELCGGFVSALEPGEVAPRGFVETSTMALAVMPSPHDDDVCPHCGRSG
jgi:hypothetical protein